MTERAIVNLARAAHARTGSTNLCLAGGVALNAMANRRILDETPIEQLFIPPAPGDSGGALGAALFVEHWSLGRSERVPLEHAYWGSRYSTAQIAAALEEAEGVEYRELADEAALLAETVDALAAGDVVGWFQGRFEFGPRALGNRSILADPRRAEMKERINEKIKFREPFRPFAPAAAEELAETLAAAGAGAPASGSLHAPDLPARPRSSPRGSRPSTTSAPRASRPCARSGTRGSSTCSSAGARRSGMPVLLNTSFNLRGEPIVASPQDALSHLRAERARPARARELRRPEGRT